MSLLGDVAHFFLGAGAVVGELQSGSWSSLRFLLSTAESDTRVFLDKVLGFIVSGADSRCFFASLISIDQ